LSNQNTNYVTYLIELSQQGRRNAFFDLCEINQKNIIVLIYYILADFTMARQIAINVYFHVWDNIKNFNLNTSYLEWVKDLAIKHAMFELNRNGFNKSYKEVNKTAISQLHQLDKLIISLPDEERVALILHDMEDMDYPETKKYLNHLSVDEILTKLINAREYIIKNI